MQKPPHLKVAQGGPCGFATGVAAHHAAALLPAALAFDLVGEGPFWGHAHPPAVAAEELSVGQPRGFRDNPFTRRAICDSDNQNTRGPYGTQNSRGGGGNGHHGALLLVPPLDLTPR